MLWHKLGRIYLNECRNNYLFSHTSNPLPIHIKDDVFRIFFSSRDKKNRSSVGYVDFDISQLKLIRSSDKPVITFGANNSFYSHGISIGNVYEVNEKSYILFMGWQLKDGEHWRGDIGRIELINNDKMNVSSEKPFLGVDHEDKISLSYPWVLFHDGIYKMWYGSTISWNSSNGEMIHVLKYATSLNGETWTKHGIAIPYELGVAQAFSKPSVFINNKGYHMWYSYRSGTGEKYKIGYAHSLDGIKWERKHQEVGITNSERGWDSEMLCYPYIFKHKNNLFMLYNGNQFGESGFGLAILKERF